MRYLALFFLPLALSAQSAESDQRVTQALISEVHELRLAIERSTLLNARTTLAISQLQMQEQSITRLTTQLNDLKQQGAAMNGQKARFAEEVKDLEAARSSATDPQKVKQFEQQMKETKFMLEQATAVETARASRESELSSQLMAAQNQIAASRARIDEMERALDTAIQQLLKK
jgi:hypothetical protein